MRICMYVCMYVYIYIYMHTRTCMHTYMHTCKPINTVVYTCMCMYIYSIHVPNPTDRLSTNRIAQVQPLLAHGQAFCKARLIKGL